jgi:lipoprotein-releasing system permease protein
MPRQRRFKVVGTFRLGLFEVDSSTGVVSLEQGMRLAGTDRVDRIELKVANIYDAPRIADEIAANLGAAYATQDWADINKQLYSALLLEKIGMGIGIGLIVAVAALNIVASLILLVMEKTRFVTQHHVDLPAAGFDHWRHRHADRRRQWGDAGALLR